MTRLLASLIALCLAMPAFAAELGDDGLHKTAWQRDTFRYMADDLEEANAEGKRLLIMIEQRGCIYCTKMHETVFPVPEINALLSEKYFVVQINMFGDVEVVDFDGTALPEKDMVRRWGMMFTPTLMFLPEEVDDGQKASEAAVVVMPGAFEKGTTQHLLQWVLDKGYDSDEPFQKYLARQLTQ